MLTKAAMIGKFTLTIGVQMEDFYIGGASVKLFLPIFKMSFPDIVDIALPAEGVFHNLAFVSIKKTYPMRGEEIAGRRFQTPQAVGQGLGNRLTR